MSTRANIIIRENTTGTEVVLYSHCDGYPDGVGENLGDTISDFCRFNEGHINPANLTAAIMTSNTFDYKYEYDTYNTPIHGDIDYLYIIEIGQKNRDVTLSCYEAPEIGSDIWKKNEYWNEPDYLKGYILFKRIYT